MGHRPSIAVSVLLRTRVLGVGAVVAVASALFPPFAGAAVPAFADACGGANNLDPATCERLDYIASQQDSISQAATYAWWGIWTACGILLVLLIAQPFVDSFKFWK